MKSYVVAANNQPEQPFNSVAYVGEAETYEIDLSPWVEDNHSVTSVTWTVQQGEVAVSGQALVGNVASALITFAQAGGNLIKITATTSAEIHVIYLDILVKDLLLPDLIDGGLYV